MAQKPILTTHHPPNCDCCGKQASFAKISKSQSGFGPLKSAPLPTKKLAPHSAPKSPERAATASERRKSLQHGNEANKETSPEDTYKKLSGEDHTYEDIGEEIAEEVADRTNLQAKESRLKGTHRDKESLLEECSNLKTAFADQRYHLQLHKVHYESVYLEQRRIEIAIEQLEMANGLEAPRTGGSLRLKAKFLGLKCRQVEYFTILGTIQDDLDALRKDPRVSFTNEADVERDVFATETRRLQKMVRRLRTFYHKVCVENNEVVRLREDIAKLTIKIKNSELSLKEKKSLIDQMKIDIDKAKYDAIQAQKQARNANYKADELQSHALVLKDMLIRGREEGRAIHAQNSALTEQTRNVKKENADRELAAKMAAAQATAEAGAAAAKAAAAARRAQKAANASQLASEASDASSLGSGSSGSHGDGSDADSDGKGGKKGKGKKGGKGSKDAKALAGAREAYLKEIRTAATKFIESAPASRAGSPAGGTPGDHSDYELLRSGFEDEISESEQRFLDSMETLVYGSPRSKESARDKAKRLAAELEALKKATSSEAFLQNLTIQVDDQILKPHEYEVDEEDSGTTVRITSPGRSPEALARKAAEDEARRLKEAEDAKRRAAEEEARKLKAAEDEAAGAKKAAEDAAKAAIDAEAKKKQDAEAAVKRAAEAENAAAAAKEAAAAAAAAESSKAKGKGLFDDKTTNVIKKNIEEVLGHLEVITESVQQKATVSGTAESTAKDILDKLEQPKK